tara:strand:- start:336 stop:527 length:192 start_codon:yes stop_codon:yes gene_type:complete
MMATIHTNLSKQEKHNIMADINGSKAYAECGYCGVFVVEEESGDGDVYSTIEDYCALNNCEGE